MSGLRYLFVDMNAYFASVEQQERPALRDKPVAVVAVLTDSTCCIAASYEAKAFGVKTGTSVRDARRLCPSIRFIEAGVKRYVEYHHRIVEAVESCLHVDQVSSIDEMYGRLLGSECEPENAAAMAFQVKDAIRQAVGPWMRCSVGIASNAWLAKVASDLNKPDGMTMILPSQMPEAICHLALTDLPGISINMQRRLHGVGITTVIELCGASEAELSKAWGGKVSGSLWWHQLRGHDLPYRPTHRRSVSHSHVLPPQWRNDEKARAVAMKMLHKAAARMRGLGYQAGSLTLSLRYLDGRRWKQRVSLGLCRDTLTMARELGPLWASRPVGEPMKVGVVLDGLVSDGNATLPLYADQSHLDGLADTMDRLDDKYGRHTLYLGGMYGAEETAPTRVSFTQIPGLAEFGEE